MRRSRGLPAALARLPGSAPAWVRRCSSDTTLRLRPRRRLWLADHIIPEAPGHPAVRDAGKPLLFLTNNASYVPSWIVAASRRAASRSPRTRSSPPPSRPGLIEREGLVGQRAFVLGVQSLSTARRPPGGRAGEARDEGGGWCSSPDVDLTYERLTAASDAVRGGASCRSNRDNVMPIPGGFEPGTGSISPRRSGEQPQGDRPGKPELPMMQAAADGWARPACDGGGSLRLRRRRRATDRLGRRPGP